MEKTGGRFHRALRWSEQYTKTDMVYLAHGGFWLTLELAVAIIFSFTLAVVFGHWASKDLYGNYKYVLSLTSLLAAVSLSGIATALTQSTARGHEGALAQGFQLNIRWSIPMSILALGVGVFYFLQNNLFVAVSMLIVALLWPLLSSFSLFDNFLIGRREFSKSAIYSMVSNLFSTLVLVAVLFIGGRAIMLVLAYFVVNTATAAFFYFRAQARARNHETDPDMFRYGFHLSVMSTIGAIANQIDSIAVFAILGPIDLAIYAYAIAIPEQMKNVLKNIVPLSMPKFGQRTLAEIKENIYARMLYLTCIVGVGAGLYALAAPWLFAVLFPVYLSSVPFSQLYVISLLFMVPGPLAVSALQAHKKTRALYIATNTGPIVLLLTLPGLTYVWGIEGAVASQILYRIVNMSVSLWQFAVAKD
ncbi:MAG TPA: oligosaccharide flippase family protein [Candidatus Paceibacterota bacterium]|nr:oligosaccharide flippase family protein [Candidatus Paceibacterota bacterium]